MNKIHLRKQKNKRKLFGNIIFIIVILILIITIMFIKFVSDKIRPVLLATGELKVNKYSLLVMNKAIEKEVEDKIDQDSLFVNIKDNNDNIVMIDLNPNIINKVLSGVTKEVLNDLKSLEDGDIEKISVDEFNLTKKELKNLKKGIIASVPIGAATNIVILANLGPKIPIRIHYIGDVNTSITTKVTSFGLNNALLEVGIHLEVTSEIVFPFTTNEKVIATDMPIAIKVLEGSVPSFYGGYLNN